MEKDLTKDALKSLANIYDSYSVRRNAGKPKSASINFDDTTPEGKRIIQEIREDRAELKAAGYITVDILGGVTLRDKGIIYMENRFADAISKGVSIISQLIPH